MEGSGGRTIWKAGDTVRRAAGFWTPRLHEYLTFLNENGFPYAPKPLGIQTNCEEILTFIPGQVGNYPLSEAVRSKMLSFLPPRFSDGSMTAALGLLLTALTVGCSRLGNRVK
jgi:hypothetical protein